MALTSQQNELIKLYVAGFLRAPEKGGFEYWSSVLNGGTSMSDLAETIFSLPIVKQIYPDTLSSRDFVTAIYQNVFNKAPDAGGLTYWTGKLDGNGHRGQLVLDMINAGLNVADGTPGKAYITNRVSVANYEINAQLDQYKEIAPDTLKSVLAQVTDTNTSVTQAQASTNTTLGNITSDIAKAFTNEFIAAAMHWQIDHGQYTADTFTSIDIATGATHAQFLDLFSLDVHTNLSPTTAGYVTVNLYHEHNWKLKAQDLVEFITFAKNDAYLNRAMNYMDSNNLDGYIRDTQASASTYDHLVAQAPSYASFWF